MIDIKHLRSNSDAYKDSAQQRGVSVDIDKLLELDGERSKLLAEIETLRAQLNVKGKPSDSELKALQEAKSKLESLEKDFATCDAEHNDLLMSVPNLLAEGTPEGGEESNKPEKTWGEASKREARDHVELSEANDWLDFERGAKVAGSKFLFSKGPVVRLEMAVMQLAMDIIEKAGFVTMSVPHMVNSRVLEATGFQPRGEERQVYKVEDQDLNLIATAELPLTGYHADEILEADSLPLLYAGISPCYRLEAGAYGKHSKGYYRVHQFDKLEMYAFCTAEQSAELHEKILALEESICQALEIPYRIVRIAAGDLGAPAFKKYDVEYWSPVDGEYRELTSCSNCTDYQARRLNIRTRGTDGKTESVHTLNGTAIAFSRVYIALLDNHQTEDGKVMIPAALQSYYGKETL